MLTKKQRISELKESQVVDDIFVVKFKKGFNEYKNGFAFDLTLSDNSGKNIEYKYWGDFREDVVKALYDKIKADSIVHIQGKISKYKDKLQLSTNEPMKIEVLEKGQYNESDFVPGPRKDIEQMYSQFIAYISLVGDSKIKELLNTIFNREEIKNKLKNHPGAIEIHHGWIGGLVQHNLEVLEYCKKSWEMFPNLNKDLIIAGAMLHDIGKLDEIEVTSRIKGNNYAQLMGHLSLSLIFVSNECDKISLDPALRAKILHIINSHHGKLEFGSPKEPMLPEAVAVYYADELSSKITEMLEFIERAKQDTEDDFMYNKRSGKNIFLK